MRIAIDTNVLAYAEGVNDEVRRHEAVSLLSRLPRDSIVLPVQVLGELFNVLIRVGGWPASQARDVVEALRESVAVVATTQDVMSDAMSLACEHRIRIWDAVILSAAAEGGCGVLLSEDMHDGFVWSGVTVVNSFAARPHPLLAGLLQQGR